MSNTLKILCSAFFLISCQTDYSKDIEVVDDHSLAAIGEFNYPEFKKNGWAYRQVDRKKWNKLDDEVCQNDIKDIIKQHNLNNSITVLSDGACFKDINHDSNIYELFPDVGTTHTQFIYVTNNEGHFLDQYLLTP